MLTICESFLHVVVEANERRLYSQAKWFSNNFIASGLRDIESQELSVSFEFQLKCTIIRYMGFTIVKTYLCYKKITREYRLVRDFNFIIPYAVSQSVLLGCTVTDTFVNKFSNLSALVAQKWVSSCWVSTWFTITSKNTITPLKMPFIKLKN